jgi:multidrug efflux pump subunit AcrA (membrane-fusion protein)
MRDHTRAAVVLLGLMTLSTGRLQAAAPEARGDTVRVGSECAGVLLVVGAEVGEGEKVEPARLVTVTVGGVAKKFRRWREGDRIVEGQLVARLDDRAARAEVAVRAARVEEAKAGHEAAVKAREVAAYRVSEMARSRRLAPFSVGDVEYQEAQEVLARRKREEVSLALKARLERARLRQDEVRVKQHEVRAPASGVVQKVVRARGEAVGLGETILEVRLEGTEAREKTWVPARRGGRLVVLGRPLLPGEKTAPGKAVAVETSVLFVKVAEGPVGRDAVSLPGRKGAYRPWKAGDELPLGGLVVPRQKVEFRPLEVGDRVREGEVLALVAPEESIETVSSKVILLEEAEVAHQASLRKSEEARRRVEAMEKARRAAPGSVSDSEYKGARMMVELYQREVVARAAGVKAAQAELLAALEVLDRRFIRAPFAGRVTALARHRGEVVKEGEAVVQIESAP